MYFSCRYLHPEVEYNRPRHKRPASSMNVVEDHGTNLRFKQKRKPTRTKLVSKLSQINKKDVIDTIEKMKNNLGPYWEPETLGQSKIFDREPSGIDPDSLKQSPLKRSP